ncbi:MAG: hypothetical protein ACYS29_00795, partial [Planctomycetota bacterium]
IALPDLSDQGYTSERTVFPFEYLSAERDKAGVVKVRRPQPDPAGAPPLLGKPLPKPNGIDTDFTPDAAKNSRPTTRSPRVECAGKVVTADGSPIEAAKVLAYQIISNEVGNTRMAQIGEATTAGDGAFVFKSRPLPRDTDVYVVAVKEGLAIGWAVWKARRQELTGWKMLENTHLEIRLGEPAKLGGVIVDEDDRPVAGAQIGAILYPTGASQDQQQTWLAGVEPVEWLFVKSDERGRFQFDNIPSGAKVDLMVAAEGKATTFTYKPSKRARFTAGQIDIKVVLPAEGRIEGRIVDRETGQELGGLELCIHHTYAPALFYHKFSYVSGPDGSFSIGALGTGEYLVRGDFPTTGVDVESGRTTKDVIIEFAGAVMGRVTDPNGEPLANAEVQIRGGVGPGHVSDTHAGAMTDERGYYRTAEIGGPYRVGFVWLQHVPSGEGYRHQYMRLSQVQKGTQTVDFQFKEFPKGTAGLVVEVVDQQGKAVTDFAIDVRNRVEWKDYSKDLYQYGHKVRVRATDDTFKLTDLPAGVYWVNTYERSQWRGYAFPEREQVTLEEGKTLRITRKVIKKPPCYGRILFEDGSPAVPELTWSGPGQEIYVGSPFDRNDNHADNEGYFTVYLTDDELERVKAGAGKLEIFYPSYDEPHVRYPIGNFPVELLAREKREAGAHKIIKPVPPPKAVGEAIRELEKRQIEANKRPDVQVEGGEDVRDISFPSWLKARTLNLAADRSIGMLKTRKWDPNSRWPDEDFAEARGEVNVPAGCMLGLEIAREKPVDLSPLEGLNPTDLQSLFLYRTQVRDTDLRHISHLTGLEQIGMGITNISDEGLEYLSGLKNLKELNLSRTRITDVGVVHLRGLGKLKILLLADTSITDASVDHLKELKSLEFLRIRNTKITPHGIITLKQALPECSIDHDISTKHESDWGQAVEGLQCRLRARKAVWQTDETPEFALDICNVGDQDIMCATIIQYCEIEYDGQWYEWIGPKYAEILSFPLKSGKENSKAIRIKIPPHKVWASSKTSRQIKLTPGKHLIRVRYSRNPHTNKISVISSPLEIEILPEQKPGVQVEADQGKVLDWSIETSKETFYPGEPVLLTLKVTNTTDQQAEIDFGSDGIEAFSMEIHDSDGLVAKGGKIQRGGLTRIGTLVVPPGRTSQKTVVLNQWCSTLLSPGQYHVICRVEPHLQLPPVSRDAMTRLRPLATATLELDIRLVKADDSNFERILENLARRAVRRNLQNMEDVADRDLAREMIAFAESPLAVPYQLRILRYVQYTRLRWDILDTLARSGTLEAAKGLVQIFEDRSIYKGDMERRIIDAIYRLRETGKPAIVKATNKFVAKYERPILSEPMD